MATFLLFIGEMCRFVKKHWRAGLIVLGIVALLVGVLLIRGCIVQQRIDAKQDEVIETRIEEANKDAVSKTAGLDVERTTKTAHSAANASKTAIQNAQDARKANVKDVSADELHQAHCEAYPEDCK